MKFILSDAERLNRKDCVEKYLNQSYSYDDSLALTANELGVKKRQILRWIEKEKEASEEGYISFVPHRAEVKNTPKLIEFADIPEDDIPVEEILDILEKRNKKRLEAAKAKNWQTIKVNVNKPIVVAFVGDPHLDDNGCDIELLRKHAALMSKDNVFAFNIGDSSNNWVGNLMRLYAQQDTSVHTARKLIKWFLNDSGINWLGWIMGNHDLWENGSEIQNLMNTRRILMEDWTAKLKLQFPSGMEVPIWIAHDFKGRSNFSKVHGAVKVARERRGASIYVCGHTHDAGYYVEEHPDTGEIFHALRVRGYKFNDSHAIVNGFTESQHGATMAAVIDPNAKDLADAITIFYDLEKAVVFRDALDK